MGDYTKEVIAEWVKRTYDLEDKKSFFQAMGYLLRIGFGPEEAYEIIERAKELR